MVRAFKPIQLGSEKLCSQDVTLLSAEGVFSFIIEELHEQNCLFIEIEKSINIYSKRKMAKTLIGLVKYIKNGEKHSTESRSSGHSDTNLEALPAKSVLLSAAK